MNYEIIKINEENVFKYSLFKIDDECKYLCSKFLTTNISSKAISNPRVFTEQGVYILATILKEKKLNI